MNDTVEFASSGVLYGIRVLSGPFSCRGRVAGFSTILFALDLRYPLLKLGYIVLRERPYWNSSGSLMREFWASTEKAERSCPKLLSRPPSHFNLADRFSQVLVYLVSNE